MKKTSVAEDDDPLDREISFSNPRPNPYARSFYKSRNLRILAPDLLEAFPDSETVNEALRELMRLRAPKKRSAKTATAPKKKARS